MNILKNNKTILILILLLGFLLRIWNLNKPEGLWNDEYIVYTISMLKFPFDFFEGIRSNCHAPLHYFYLKLWMMVFKNSDFMLRMSSLVPNFLGCSVMYFVGKNYQTKNSSIKIGLCCAAIASISSFLIYFSQEVRIYSMIFLFSSLILLFSIKMYENPSKQNAICLTFFSILLILEHTIGFVFVLFNIFALIAFRQKKKKKDKNNDYYKKMLAWLVLCLPIVPFIFRLFLHPTYFSQWWSPFNWSKIFFYFTDLFSPVLKNLTNSPDSFYGQIISVNGNLNIGFVLFALIPSLIALFLIMKAILDKKRINKYLLTVFLTVFLTVLIAAIVGKIVFLTKYLTELYPILILFAAVGWNNLYSKNTKITLATIYLFMSLFFIVVSHTSAPKLVRTEGQRLPILTMNEMGIKKNDKILFLFYPKKSFLKYYNDNDYTAYTISKYNFPEVYNKGTIKDAFECGHELYKVFFKSKRC